MGRRWRVSGSSNQLPLNFGDEALGPPSGHRLFFAILPEPEIRGSLTAAARRLCERYALSGPVQPAARMHITLMGFQVNEPMLSAATWKIGRIGAAVRRAPFPVVMDGAMSFGGKGNHAQVLRCSQGSEAALTGLHDQLQDLTDDLRMTDPDRNPRYAPHLTVAYDHRTIPETALDALIGWTTDKLVLVHSEQGRGRHTILGSWPLRAN